MINSRNFFDKSVKNDIETYGSIRKNAADEGDYFTTVCLLDYSYLNENCMLIQKQYRKLLSQEIWKALGI